MYTFKPACSLVLPLLALAALSVAGESPGLGEEMSDADVARVDFSVLPDGTGLPAGSGSAAEGRPLYRQHCLACHGENGEGALNDRLAGGEGSIDGPAPVKTVGSYWPYATTLFDYLRRAMPYPAPGSLNDDELYAVTAYVLYLNGIVAEEEVLDADRLPRIEMPNRENFIRAWPP